MTDVTRCSEGELFNADARLGARILETAGRLAALDKQARRTPPRTLLAERRKVEAARLALDDLKTELCTLLGEHAVVRALLGRTDRGLSDEYLAIRSARVDGLCPDRRALRRADAPGASREARARRVRVASSGPQIGKRRPPFRMSGVGLRGVRRRDR